MKYVVFDIGGTHMRVAGYDGASLGDVKKINTPPDFEDGMHAMERLIADIAGGEEIEAVAGGIAGPLNKKEKKLYSPPHLPGWTGMPFQARLEEIADAPVYIDNDTAVVGLGEAGKGAGVGHNIVAYITVSTGVGGVRVVNGKIDVNRYGFEPGHQIIDIDGSECPDCSVFESETLKGHLEAYVSGTSLKERFNTEPEDIEEGSELWEELARWLAAGLSNTILHWSPDVVVLGGSMMVKSPGIDIERVEKHLKIFLAIFPELPELKKAKLQDNGGLIGATFLLKENFRRRE